MYIFATNKHESSRTRKKIELRVRGVCVVRGKIS